LLAVVIGVSVAGCVTALPESPGPSSPGSSSTPPASASPGSSSSAGTGPTSTANTSDEPPVVARVELRPEAIEPFSGIGNQYVFDGVAVGDGFVVAGEDLQFAGAGTVDGAIWTSPDGARWTRVDTASNDLDEAEIDHLAIANGVLDAIGGARPAGGGPVPAPALMWRSTDGRRWTRVDVANSPLAPVHLTGLTGGAGGFVAWGLDGLTAVLYQSADGQTWRKVSDDATFSGFEIMGAAAVGSGFVAVGGRRGPETNQAGGPDTSTAAAWWSADGAVWLPAVADGGHRLAGLAVGSSGMLAFSGGDCGGCIAPRTVWHSDDGRAWRELGPDVAGWPSYASDGRRIVRFGWQSGGEVTISSDGSAWQVLGTVGSVSSYGLVLGQGGLLVIDSISRGGPPDEVDGGVRLIAFR
jgi:hypothetical protein